jgi:peptidoglycan-N-acetylglucosamine deacetylase
MNRFRALFSWLVALVVAAAVVIFVRRWIHHAQLESVPVIVPPNVPAAEVVSPPPAAILRRMMREVREALSPPKRPRLAVLTFDDGPFAVTTPALLAALQALHVPAAFFLIGRDTREQPAIALRSHRAGIELGNHTLTHPEMGGLSLDAQRAEVAGGAQAIYNLTAERPAFFRPPHGNFDAATIEASRLQGEKMVLWDIDPGDWRTIGADEVAADVIDRARSPAVILLHNGKPATIEALPRIVNAYRAAGFEFVTLDRLLQALPLDDINDPIKVDVGRR